MKGIRDFTSKNVKKGLYSKEFDEFLLDQGMKKGSGVGRLVGIEHFEYGGYYVKFKNRSMICSEKVLRTLGDLNENNQ
jgi:hypothetical protein